MTYEENVNINCVRSSTWLNRRLCLVAKKLHIRPLFANYDGKPVQIWKSLSVSFNLRCSLIEMWHFDVYESSESLVSFLDLCSTYCAGTTCSNGKLDSCIAQFKAHNVNEYYHLLRCIERCSHGEYCNRKSQLGG